MRLQTVLVLVPLVVLFGCETKRLVSPGPIPGHSYHFRFTKDESNLPDGVYPDPPKMTGDKGTYGFFANQYLEGLRDDIKLIELKRKNAEEKVAAVRSAFYSLRLGQENFFVSYVSRTPKYGNGIITSNLKKGYDDFPNCTASSPQRPLYSNGSFEEASIHRAMVADFFATIDAYQADAGDYIENTKRDQETLRQKAKEFVRYLHDNEVRIESDLSIPSLW